MLKTLPILCAASVLAVPASGMQSQPPGPQFGAILATTRVQPPGWEHRWALQFDLFTELGKELVPGTGEFIRYNDIPVTIGMNQFGWTGTHARALGRFGLTHTLQGGLGAVSDALPRFVQNDLAHGLRKLAFVPRDDTATGLLTTGGYRLRLFSAFDIPVYKFPAVPHFGTWTVVPEVSAGVSGGAQVGGGSMGLAETYVQAGLDLEIPDIRVFIAHVHWRRGWTTNQPVGIGNGYEIRQGGGTIDLSPIIGSWFPALTVVRSQMTGGFIESNGDDKVENFVAIRLEVEARRFGVETWNDVGSKDHGPTAGLRINWWW